MTELPAAFLAQMREILGSETDAFLEAMALPAPTSLRLNPAKPGAAFVRDNPVPWNPHGLYLEERPRFFLDPLIYAGGYYVQEASSMVVGAQVDFSKPLKILDLCAAPGGKSTMIAALMHPDSLLVSNEVVGGRARILAENMARWGHPNTVVTHNHPRDFSRLHGFFDVIFVDAPCSGEGMFRKDPAVIDHWSPKMVRDCADRQQDILEAVAPALQAGGKLVYSTCTYNRIENEGIVGWMLDRNPGEFHLLQANAPQSWGFTPGDGQPEFPEAMQDTQHAYLHRVKGEGFYFGVLEKQHSGHSSSPKSNKKRKGKRGNQAQSSFDISQQIKKAAAAWLEAPDGFEYHALGENLLAIPGQWATDYAYLNEKLRIINAGIRVGKPKGKTLIPAHELAMSLHVIRDFPAVDLDLSEALHYLKRAEFAPETGGIKGWALARYKGVNLGWMKVLDNRVNNHFPREMRIRSEIPDMEDLI